MIELRWPIKVVRRFVVGGLVMYVLALVLPLDGESRWFVLAFAILMAGCVGLGMYLAGERFRADEQGLARLVWGELRGAIDWREVTSVRRVFPNDLFTQLSIYGARTRIDVISTVENFAGLAALVRAHVDPARLDDKVRRMLDEASA